MDQPTKVIKNHDFRRTDLLERINLQTLQGLLETFARAATQRFTSTLRQPCSFEVDALDQLPWRELAGELEDGWYFFTFSLSPLPGRAVFAMPTDEVLALVDVRLAGAGDDDFTGRIPSEIDQAFLAPIIEDLIGELSRSLSRIQATTPWLDEQEGNVQFVAMGSPSEMFMAARLSVTIANRPVRHALICLPFTMVRSLIEAMKSRAIAVGESPGDFVGAVTRRRLLEVPLDVVFQFPSFVTTPAELLTLRVGDNLGLGHPKGRPLEVRVEGLLVAFADICSSGVHKACEIREEVTK